MKLQLSLATLLICVTVLAVVTTATIWFPVRYIAAALFIVWSVRRLKSRRENGPPVA